MLILSYLMACSTAVLTEVKIVGGTAEQQALIRAELIAFDEAIGPGRLEVSKVQIGGLPSDVAGRYKRASKKIVINENALTGAVLRHELCHALEHSEDLVGSGSELFDVLAAGIFSPDFEGQVPIHGATENPEGRRSEALAMFCEVGPLLTKGLLDGCEDRHPLDEMIANWYFDNVYRAYKEPTPYQIVEEQAVVVNGPQPDAALWVYETFNPEVIRVSPDEDRIGEYRTLSEGQLTSEEPDAPRYPLKAEAPSGMSAYPVGTKQGSGATFSLADLHYLTLNADALRIIVYKNSQWHRVVNSCDADINQALFAVGEELWIGERGSNNMKWRPIKEVSID